MIHRNNRSAAAKPAMWCLVVFTLTACAAQIHVPSHVPIHDGYLVLVAADVDLGRQTVYKNETLEHFNIDGVDAYCSRAISNDLTAYRCFSLQGGLLVMGMHPQTFQWIPLTRSVPINKLPR